MENNMETLGSCKGVYRDITPIMENEMENEMEAAMYRVIEGLYYSLNSLKVAM